VTGLVLLWAARLGPFLFRRVHSVGKDSRFDTIRDDLVQMFLVHTLSVSAPVPWLCAASVSHLTRVNRVCPGVGRLGVLVPHSCVRGEWKKVRPCVRQQRWVCMQRVTLGHRSSPPLTETDIVGTLPHALHVCCLLGSAPNSTTHVCLATPGVALFAMGFLLEWVADAQKRSFNSGGAAKNKWIQHGLWRCAIPTIS